MIRDLALLTAQLSMGNARPYRAPGAIYRRSIPKMRLFSKRKLSTNEPHIGLLQQIRGLKPTFKAHARRIWVEEVLPNGEIVTKPDDIQDCPCETCQLFVKLVDEYECRKANKQT